MVMVMVVVGVRVIVTAKVVAVVVAVAVGEVVVVVIVVVAAAVAVAVIVVIVGVGHGAHCTGPDWCYPLCGTVFFFYAAPVLFSCSMRRFPSISMCLPPSPCLQPVVDMFVFLCCRVFLLCVRFLLLCHRCFCYANLFFSYAVPLFSSCSMAQVGRGDGHGAHRTRHDLFWCYPLCGTDFCLCCACPLLMLHGALSIHLHGSPPISMSLSCCRHVCFLMLTGLSVMCAVSPFMPSVFLLC